MRVSCTIRPLPKYYDYGEDAAGALTYRGICNFVDGLKPTFSAGLIGRTNGQNPDTNIAVDRLAVN